MKPHGQQALSWYLNNFLLANPDKFQSLIFNPQKLDKDERQNVEHKRSRYCKHRPQLNC